jgi:cytoskeletal protein CcmA (bactofilin family)
MFGKKEKINEPKNGITSLISADTQVDGHIIFQGGLRIDGRVNGNITAAGGKPSTLVLSEEALVQGEIRVSHAVINGTVLGPLHSYEYLEVLAHATVSGVVSYKNIEIQLGATVNGMARRVENAQPGNKVVTLISTSHRDEVT